jgi:hypothetical protein
MGILIGTDEAGYGPNLGPLVVAATAWHVDDEIFNTPRLNDDSTGNDDPARLEIGEPASAGGNLSNSAGGNGGEGSVATLEPKSARGSSAAAGNPKSEIEFDLYRHLRNIVAKSPSERRVPIADSKVLYNPAAGLRHLERGIHAVLHAMEQQLNCWSEIVHYCGADPDGCHRRVCWPSDFDCALPVHAESQELSRLGARFVRACGPPGIKPLAIRARMVFPEQFNDLVEYHGNKATALSNITVALLRDVMDMIPCSLLPAPCSPPPIYAVCDKHGGRNFYTALLQHHFSEHWIAPVYESHAQSRYEWGPPEARVRVTFRMNGEAFLPTALASMTAKYLRELAMRAFNDFWCALVPDLKPTAGYYGDSRRFKKAIETKQHELKIDDHVLWRNR